MYRFAMLTRFLLFLATLSLVGCGGPDRYIRLQGVATVHDPAATRVWIIESSGPIDSVVLCDVEMLKQSHTLCMRGAIAPAPGTMPAPPPR